jgi:hypothetical protein
LVLSLFEPVVLARITDEFGRDAQRLECPVILRRLSRVDAVIISAVNDERWCGYLLDVAQRR